MKNSTPKFYGFRIYFLTTLLYLMLVFPFVAVVAMKSLPDIQKKRDSFSLMDINIDSEDDESATFNIQVDPETLADTTLIQQELKENNLDDNVLVSDQETFNLVPSFTFLFRCILGIFLLGLLFNAPFKRYFNLKGKRKRISKRRYSFVRKWILRVPLINSLIFGTGLFISLVNTYVFLQSVEITSKYIENNYYQYFYINVIATILAVLLIYFWERHRVHLRYLDHVFSREELKNRIFKGRKGKIGNRLLISSLMTSLLPLTIVMLYIFLSISHLKDLDFDPNDPTHVRLVFGREMDFFADAGNTTGLEDLVNYSFMIYVNAWNSLFMFIGIFSGIFIAFVYLLLFVKWTTADIVRPVNELMRHMERMGEDRINEYAIVRTNDEIGSLCEGYNFMTNRLNDYIHRISGLNESYSRFVPKQFLQILGKNHIAEITTGDQIEKEMSVLFTDIRSFTDISEMMTPKENFDFINMYLSYMEPVIGRNNGFIDKYIGDSIMALFPYDVEDAINTSIEMRIKLAEFNQVITQFDKEPIDTGIGIHTGSLMLGIVGGDQRIDGTVISDAVNLASRLEGLTKIYGGSVIISEDTLTRIEDMGSYEYRFLDVVKVKGKKKAVYIFEILNGEPERCRELKKATKYDFGRAADMYQNREFKEAINLFNKIVDKNPEDKAAKFYVTRCSKFILNGVPDDWDGIERLKKL